MSNAEFVVCDGCGGVIPTSAEQIRGVQGTLTSQGATQAFGPLDFCCTAHLEAWLAGVPVVATPSPPYTPPLQPAGA